MPSISTGVNSTLTEKQPEIVAVFRQRSSATARELADTTGVSRTHVHETLADLVETNDIEAREHVAEHGACLYRRSR